MIRLEGGDPIPTSAPPTPPQPRRMDGILDDARVVHDPATAYTFSAQTTAQPAIAPHLSWTQQANISARSVFQGDSWTNAAVDTLQNYQYDIMSNTQWGRQSIFNLEDMPQMKELSPVEANKKYPVHIPWDTPVREGWAKKVSEQFEMNQAIALALADTNTAQDILHFGIGIPTGMVADPLATAAMFATAAALPPLLAAGVGVAAGVGELAGISKIVSKASKLFTKADAAANATVQSVKTVGTFEQAMQAAKSTHKFMTTADSIAGYATKEAGLNVIADLAFSGTGVQQVISDKYRNEITKDQFYTNLLMDGILGGVFGGYAGRNKIKTNSIKAMEAIASNEIQSAAAGKVSLAEFVGPRERVYSEVVDGLPIIEPQPSILETPSTLDKTSTAENPPTTEKPSIAEVKGPSILHPDTKTLFKINNGPWYSGIDNPEFTRIRPDNVQPFGLKKTYGSGMYLSSSPDPHATGSLFYGDFPKHMGEFQVFENTNLVDIRRTMSPEMMTEASKLLNEEYGFSIKKAAEMIAEKKSIREVLDMFSDMTISDDISIENIAFSDKLNARFKDKFGIDGYYWESSDRITKDGKEQRQLNNNIQLFDHTNGTLTNSVELRPEGGLSEGVKLDPLVQQDYQRFLTQPESNVGYDASVKEMHNKYATTGKEAMLAMHPDKFAETQKADLKAKMNDLQKMSARLDETFGKTMKEEVTRAEKAMELAKEIFKDLSDCQTIRGES